MAGETRAAVLKRLLQAEPFWTVGDLSAALRVSSMTVRRDLDRLAREGLVVRVHGGVMWRDQEEPVGRREGLRIREKAAIGHMAADLVRPGDTIIMDSGTTAAALARALLDSSARPLTVVTHALNVVGILLQDPSIHVSVSGGDLRPGTASLVGPVTRAFYETIRADWVFLTAVGASADDGFSNSNFAEAEIKRLVLERAKTAVMLIDATKCDVRSMVPFAPLNAVSAVISDSEMSLAWQATFARLGVEVLLATPFNAS